MNTRHLRIHHPLVLAITVAFACEAPPDADPDAADEEDEIVENLLRAGFSADAIEIRDDGTVVVGGDAVVDLQASREMVGDDSQDDDFRQYRTNNVVGAAVDTICVNGAAFTGTLSAGLDAAIANYNRMDLSLRFLRTSGPNAACDATITAVVVGGSGGEAGFPSGGMPYSTINIGSDNAALGLGVTTHVITHELGHCVGFRHSDYYNRAISCGSGGDEGVSIHGAVHIPGTPTTALPDGSVMNACFHNGSTGVWTASDVVALRQMYPGGTDDLVWQHTNGQVNYWRMLGGAPSAYPNVGAPVGPEWTLRSSGDVDGDGTDDLVWQHTNGQVSFWRMQGGVAVAYPNISTPVAAQWRLAGVGDVDGDGTDDIVWQHTNGQVNVWRMQNGNPVGFSDLLTPVPAVWHLEGLGDLNGDGTDDIVWRHDSGQVHYWRMRAGVVDGFADISTPVAAAWALEGMGDVDGDGTDDLVWQHDNGQVNYWRMQGGSPIAFFDIATPVGAEWRLAAVGDVDG